MTQANYSSILQVLIDAENPLRIATGDRNHLLVNALVAVGLVDYRKSGWYQTSEKGLRLASGSMGVTGFKLALEHLTRQVLEKNHIQARPLGLRAKETRAANQLVWAAEFLARLNARNEQETRS